MFHVMSMTRTKRLTFPISAHTYIDDMYFHAGYTRGLYVDGLGFTTCEQLQFERLTHGGYKRTLRLCPTINAPKAVQKILGETQQYDEIGHYDAPSRTWRYEVIPSTMANKVKTNGRMVVEAQGKSECSVMFEVTFDVSIFGVGAIIEKFMGAQFDENLLKQERFTRSWIASSQ